MLVAAVKSLEGRLYGAPSDLTVLRAYDVPAFPLPAATRVVTPG